MQAGWLGQVLTWKAALWIAAVPLAAVAVWQAAAALRTPAESGTTAVARAATPAPIAPATFSVEPARTPVSLPVPSGRSDPLEPVALLEPGPARLARQTLQEGLSEELIPAGSINSTSS